MTMQTTKPLARIEATGAAQEPLFQIAGRFGVILDAPYQRGSVWGPTRQRNLFRSLLLGIPVGMVYLNERPDGTDAIVDGRQRIEAYRALVSNDLALPASWFDEADYGDYVLATGDGPYVRWSDLSERGRGKINRCGIAVTRTRFATVEEEAGLFDLVNFGGVAQGASDL